MTALTAGMPCTCAACARRGLASTSIFASTHAPSPSPASFSSTGLSWRHGPHHAAQKSSTTGTCMDRSITSSRKVASVTSITCGAVGALDAVLPGIVKSDGPPSIMR
jgi:hypothetical protein